MNTYDYIKGINLIKLYSSENDNKIKYQLEIIADQLKNQILKNFDKLISEEKSISNIKIEYENPCYRQSATGIIYTLNFANDENFKIYIEVLIDLSRILIYTKGIPEKKTLKELNKKIVAKYNHESKTEFKEVL
ncbi:hypothetical protein NG800_014360 [Epilithonimonas ginsengisoli]|uniref:Addiction module toxin RelE n=1 Tax=Epilithonimonas ginsengisoli TaxID=1245592 RepID=A0ABU4JKD1_9FLAO|nr:MULTISPECIES: hypothetical protein [Chryseobacterium group]MBV6881139.1 hypothetical protein [Epilithonimonas sp. FP105]MDW8550106.1 hypothetical protein [Epilithonimonas ginsengisoli]OAH71904.1 hypothetical protein AXA65_11250 [Chryseobacterium sp. FP211-J200]